MKVNAIAYAKMIALLMSGLSAPECAEETGLAERTVNDYINALRNEKVCFIIDYTEDSVGRKTVAVHKLGEGRDKKHVKVGNVEACRRYRDRQKSAKRLGLIT